jgi:hypothetical protein
VYLRKPKLRARPVVNVEPDGRRRTPATPLPYLSLY